MNQFEQLIEYVINDDEQKARALFHDIVVGKSREIYESLMAEEEEIDEAKDEDLDEDAMGGDAADDLIDDVEAEEQDDMSMEAEGDDVEELDVEVDGEGDMDDMGGDDMGGDDMGGEEELEDRVMDLEDKLDELMAEFEGLMGGDDMGDGDGFGADEGGDAIEVDDTEEMMPEMGNYGMMENVSLKAAPKPVTSEEGGVNKKSTVAANAGAKGPIGSTVKPVSTTGAEAHGRPAPTAKDLIGKVGNTPAQGTQKPSAATKPKTGQEGGVNNKSIVPGKHN
jgi:hypothetical protein